MTAADWQRAAALYLPLTATALGRTVLGSRPRQFAASLLSVLWTAPALLLLQLLNRSAHWWTFPAGSEVSFRGMPLELYLGWIVLWGILPQLVLPGLGILPSAAILVALDCLLMPFNKLTLQLSSGWLVGEAVAVCLILLPALSLARWTLTGTHLVARAALQLISAALLFLFLLPELVFALRLGPGWAPLFSQPHFALPIELQLVFLLALPGISAVFEFAQRGRGTPIPYDPPRRLVTSGIYRFVANPMQLSCTFVLVAWAALLANGWILAVALISLIYSAGIARWDERQDLALRFGEPWSAYRAHVRDWSPRFRPYHAGPPALLSIARTCGPCSQLRLWFEARHPLGLTLVDAETLPAGSIDRLRYDPQEGTPPEYGVRAFARALEHLHLGWALAGLALRLPILWRFIQLLMDVSGFGPRTLQPLTSPRELR